MPTYEYVCKSCGHLFEIVQSMRDDALTECPVCGGELRKVFAPPAIAFKGSGFYATDHGKKSKQPLGTKESSSDGSGDAGKEGSGKEGSGKEGSDAPSGGKKTSDPKRSDSGATSRAGKGSGQGSGQRSGAETEASGS